MATRAASHAGSWYSSKGEQLRAELTRNLAEVKPIPELDYSPPVGEAKAIIGPHAGYSYSGRAAAWAYAAIPTNQIKRVFLLGPSHHYYLDTIALSQNAKYATPLGDIHLDAETIKALKNTGKFSLMDRDADEDEHSLEMHLPYIRHVFADAPDLKLVPLLVGSVSSSKMDDYADILSDYWNDPATFWIISSDFCHWGTRFSHTPYYAKPGAIQQPVPPVPPSFGATNHSGQPDLIALSRSTSSKLEAPIWESIQYMDHEAIEILRDGGKSGTGKRFREYLKRTGNTICGRNPISQLLAILERASGAGNASTIKFVRYEQSSRNESLKDSSVSYVSGIVIA